MAALDTVDILKRDNANVLLGIMSQRGTMKRGKTCQGDDVTLSPMIKLGRCIFTLNDHNSNCVREMLLRYCEFVKGQPPEVMLESGEWVRITGLYKDARFVPKNTIRGAPKDKDKAFQQRQERSLVECINTAGGIKVELIDSLVVRAEQAPDIGPHGKENLVDVVVYDLQNNSFNVSCKQTSAADLGGGGMTGLTKTVPELVNRLYDVSIRDLKSLGFEQGHRYNVAVIPQIQYKIPAQYTYKIFRGSESVGGTIDYMYIGPAHVVLVNGSLNGLFIPVAEYARKKTYYFRLRKRDVFENTVTINYEKLNINGYPVIFTSGHMNCPAARFVVEDRVLSTAIMKELDNGNPEAS